MIWCALSGPPGGLAMKSPARRRVALVAHAQLAAALQDEEHLLVGMVVVQREGALARRHRGDVVAQHPRTDARADHANAAS